ncbi:hypothetical protein H0H92_014130 [Tricholoma furcatifolium]|nr:hypothetical protein H0H92_014130 [Tricholoma furcatifolium]
MEVRMKNIGYNVTHAVLSAELAKVLHSSPFSQFSSVPMNFHVYLFKDQKGLHPHSGHGALTLPSREIGQYFLAGYGDVSAASSFIIHNRRIKFALSDRAPHSGVLESVIRRPYIDPVAVEAKRQRDIIFREQVAIKTLQFGWECRDGIFSVEWEHSPYSCHLSFDDEQREIRVRISRLGDTTLAIVIRFSNLITKSVHTTHVGEHVVFLTLESPPIFESEPHDSKQPRIRLSALPLSDHARVSPYVSQTLRLICPSVDEKQKFLELCRNAELHHIDDKEYLATRRGLFSARVSEQLRFCLQRVHWCIAFQLESLLRSWSVDMIELLGLIPLILELKKSKDKHWIAAMLAHFGTQVFELTWDEFEGEKESIEDCFSRACKEFESQSPTVSAVADPNLFDSYHVEVTPTTIKLSGPHKERSNRVIRRYHPDNHESFLRVSFVDEGHLQYRFNRDVDGRDFIRNRVGPILLEGLSIANRKFEFLAYSQSALKEHTVWFVKPFRDLTNGHYVDAGRIIKSLGSFDNLAFDSNLIYCPARYGARISQAFTATDVAVTIHTEEVLSIEDITTEDKRYCFTDGVGTISSELAKEVSKELKSKRQRGRNRKDYARALQVRFQGSKGMLSVDHTLHGRAMCLRPSMIKFEDTSLDIEIARAFDRPGPYFLNRPLIMLLENLGIKYEVFKSFQDAAVSEVNQSAQSLGKAARMLETYGLASSYRLTSVMLNLVKLGVDSLESEFYQRMLQCATHHILRLLKNHARIPIPDAWTLVGVADVHKFLQEGQVFACVKPNDGPVIHLEGPVIISRSPTIHPGDVQIVHAIGSPPKDSCFSKEPLFNTVVFSVLGSRPLPSCLGGGDLDGDVYNLIPLKTCPEFSGLKTQKPATYAPAQKKLLDRPSTMNDVAEFVMEYINSDVVGIIAINWLITADQSRKGIFDENCLKLSDLHSDAVDYPKSGNPVALDRIPKPLLKEKPDWNAPETVRADSGKYYKSNRAIGRLFREITLPKRVNPQRRPGRQRQKRRGAEDELSGFMHISLTSESDDDVREIVEERIENLLIHFENPQSPVETYKHTKALFQRYVSELSSICTTYSLSYFRPLTEEEAVTGTILQKTSQPRLRQDMTAKLRERTEILVRGIRDELAGDHEEYAEEYLYKAQVAWKIAIQNRGIFGGESFGWVALGAIFDAIKEIEDAQKEDSRRRFY